MGDYRDRLLGFIKGAEILTQAAKDRAVRTEGLTVAQYNALVNLVHNPGITSSELARYCGVTAQTMSSVLNRLLDRGLVVRTPHPRHRGVLELAVTPEGQAVWERANEHVEEVEGVLRAALDPQEQEQLRRLLVRCMEVAQTAGPGAGEQD
ncbi:MarR family winged helix-turn-helix transcriptional regulator [Kineococcus sp. NUM-3379]